MNETLLTVDEAVLLAAIFGLITGAVVAVVAIKSQIKTYKAREGAKWAKLISSAMANAYSAGYADGKAKKPAVNN